MNEGDEPTAKRPHPVRDQLDQASLSQLVLELEVARQRGGQARLVAQAALIVAGLAIGAAVWAASRAGVATVRAERIEQELKARRAQPVESTTLTPRIVHAPRAAATATPAPSGGEAWMTDAMLLEIEALEAELGRQERRLTEVEGGLVEWGQETKRYVDERLRAPQPAASPTPAAELNELWLRVQALEQRVGR